jgi:hypothetical protein
MEIQTNNLVSKQLMVEIISCLFFLLFLYAAANKILDFQHFKIQLSQSPLLTSFANQVAWLIPTVEIVIAVLAILPKTRLLGMYASFGLMFMFTAYIIAILNFSDHIPCGCGGILGHLQWHEHLIFNIFFVLLGFTGILIETKKITKGSL